MIYVCDLNIFDKAEIPLIREYFPDCEIGLVNDRTYRILIGVPAKGRLMWLRCGREKYCEN